MSETTMSSLYASRYDGHISLEFEWICPVCHYPVEGMFQDDDMKDGDEMIITDTCPNCGEEVNVETDGGIEIVDLDD